MPGGTSATSRPSSATCSSTACLPRSRTTRRPTREACSSGAASPTRLVGEGDSLEIGGERFDVLVLPGHADGHIGLVGERTGRMFGGDVILDEITPNVGRWEDTRPDPLAAYLETLRRLSELGPSIVYPGHRRPIVDMPARAKEIARPSRRAAGGGRGGACAAARTRPTRWCWPSGASSSVSTSAASRSSRRSPTSSGSSASAEREADEPGRWRASSLRARPGPRRRTLRQPPVSIACTSRP